MRPFIQNPQTVQKLESLFYRGEAVLFLVFLILIWRFRPKAPSSQFRVREADAQKHKNDPPSIHEKMKPGPKPLPWSGIQRDGLPHEILGISEHSSLQEIQKAYRNLMKKYHPDLIASHFPQKSPEWQEAQKIAEIINQAKEKMIQRMKTTPS